MCFLNFPYFTVAKVADSETVYIFGGLTPGGQQYSDMVKAEIDIHRGVDHLKFTILDVSMVNCMTVHLGRPLIHCLF